MESINATIDRISSKLKNNTITLRTAQIIFLKKAEQTIKQGKKKGILILPCGLGKSLAAFTLALIITEEYEKRTGKRGKIGILSHREDLMGQLGVDFRRLCKDRKIGYLYKAKKEVNAEVLIANIRTLSNKKYLESFKKEEFVVIIVDETHRAGAVSYQTIIDYFEPEFLLGMTATPNRTDRIDIMHIYGNNIIYEVTKEESCERGWLRESNEVFLKDKWCDYNTQRCYRKKDGTYKYHIKEPGKFFSIPERDEAIIKKFKERAKDRQGIAFVPLVEEAKRMAKVFNKNGIRAIHMEGKTKPKKRKEIIEKYKKGEYQIIFNVELIGEGLHFPSVDIILLLRTTQSEIKGIQQRGRGVFNIEGVDLSTFKYKKCLILNWVGNFKENYKEYIYQLKKKKNVDENKVKDINELYEKPIGVEIEFDEINILEDFKRQFYNEKSSLLERNKEKILFDFDEGYSINKLNRKYSVPCKIISNFLKKEGRKIIPPKRHNFEKIRDEIINLYVNRNLNCRELSKKYGIHTCSIYRILKKKGVKIRSVTENRILSIDRENLFDLYHNKMLSDTKLCKFFKIGKPILKKTLKYYNISRIKKKFMWKELSEKIKELYVKKGKSMNSISREMQISLWVVKKALGNRGIYIKSREEFGKERKNCNYNRIIERFKDVLNKKQNVGLITTKEFCNHCKEKSFNVFNLYQRIGRFEDFCITNSKIIPLKFYWRGSKKESNIRKYLHLKKKLGRNPVSDEFYLICSNKQSNFLEIKKMIGDFKSPKEKYSKFECVNEYNNVKEKLKKESLSCKDISKYSKFKSYHPYVLLFGSWNNFLKKMGDEKSILRKDKINMAIKLYINENKPLTKISKKVGISRNILSKELKKRGYKIKIGINQFSNTMNLKIAKYKPLIVIPQTKLKRKGIKKTYEGINTHGYQDRTTEEKDEIRPKIVKKINNGDRVTALEHYDLSFIKEIEKQEIKPKKVTIPNNKDSVKLVNALINHGYKIQTNKNGIVELTKDNSFPIVVINTDARTWLVNTQEKPNFLWLDYCGAFSFYAKDLDILFAKSFDKMKLILTYNLFDPAKDDENFYLTRTINYVLKKVSGKNKIELLEDITYRYKKNMYNIGFNICKIK